MNFPSKHHAFFAMLSLTQTAAAVADACTSLTSLSLENTTVVNAFHQIKATNITTPISCQLTDSLVTSADVCRVQGFINTTSTSSLEFEAWLPDIWYGRFMGLGNGGTGGCL